MSGFAPLGGGGGAPPINSISASPFGGGGGGAITIGAGTCASTLEDLEFSDGVKQGYEVTSVYIDTNKRIGKGGSKEVFLLTQNSDSASEIKEFKVFKKVGSSPIDPNSYVIAIMSAKTTEDLSECLNEFFFSVEIHRCGIPMIKVHLCIVEIIFHDGTSGTITFDRNYHTPEGRDNSVGVKTTNAKQAIAQIFNKPVKKYNVHFFEERGYELQTTLDPSEPAVNDFVRKVGAQYLALDFKPENCLISLRNNNNNQLVLCDADKKLFIPVAELMTFFQYDCHEGIIQYMLSLLYINYYLYNKNKNHKLINLFGYLGDNELKQQLLNPDFLLFLAKNMIALQQNLSKDDVFAAKLNIVRYLAHYTKLFDSDMHTINSTKDLYTIMRLYLVDVQRASDPSYPHRDFYSALDDAFATIQMQDKDIENMTKNLVIHMLHCAFSPSSFLSSSPSPSGYSLQASLSRIEHEFFERFRNNVNYLSTIEDQGGLTSLGSRSFIPVRAYKLKKLGSKKNFKKLVEELNNEFEKYGSKNKKHGSKNKKKLGLQTGATEKKGGKPRNKKTHKRTPCRKTCKKAHRRSYF